MNIGSVYNKMPALGKLGQQVKRGAETWKRGYNSMNESERISYDIATMTTVGLAGTSVFAPKK